jgi:hypothetical protein
MPEASARIREPSESAFSAPSLPIPDFLQNFLRISPAGCVSAPPLRRHDVSGADVQNREPRGNVLVISRPRQSPWRLGVPGGNKNPEQP